MAAGERPLQRTEGLFYQQQKIKVVSSPSIPVPVVHFHLNAPAGKTKQVFAKGLFYNLLLLQSSHSTARTEIYTQLIFTYAEKSFKNLRKEDSVI